MIADIILGNTRKLCNFSFHAKPACRQAGAQKSVTISFGGIDLCEPLCPSAFVAPAFL
jgi:hypothetical protein